MRIGVVALAKIEDCLAKVPALVDLQQRRSPGFPSSVMDWLILTEDVLQDAGLSVVSEVAALRSALVAAMRGSGLPDGMSRRRGRESVAADVLRDAQRCVSEAIAPAQSRFREARDVAAQVAAVARAKGLITAVLDASSPSSHDARLKQLYSVLAADGDLGAAVAHLQGLTGPFDALVVLDRECPELN